MKHNKVREGKHVVVAAPAKLDTRHTYKARVTGVRLDGVVEWSIWHGNKLGKKQDAEGGDA